jgi:hypothetical protein
VELSTVSTFAHGYALPPLAPLNAPLIAQVLHQHLATTSVVDAVYGYPASLAWLQRRLPQVRAQVFGDLDVQVENGDISVTEFLSRLRTASPANKRPNPQVLSTWRDRGILQTPRRGYIPAQRAAAILIARHLAPDAPRNWLPTEISPSEPDWWCWRQDEPTSPTTVCPVPLPTDLPTSALLWVPWAGATWLPNWTPITGGAFYSGAIQTPQALIEATQIWRLPLDLKTYGVHEAANVVSTTRVIQQIWGRVMTPVVIARFAPILASTE